MLAKTDYLTVEQLGIPQEVRDFLDDFRLRLLSGEVRYREIGEPSSFIVRYREIGEPSSFIRPELPSMFNMRHVEWHDDCGTVHCIYGWMLNALPGIINIYQTRPRLAALFGMRALGSDPDEQARDDLCALSRYGMMRVTAKQAAESIHNYLSANDARWREVLA